MRRFFSELPLNTPCVWLVAARFRTFPRYGSVPTSGRHGRTVLVSLLYFSTTAIETPSRGKAFPNALCVIPNSARSDHREIHLIPQIVLPRPAQRGSR
jgi:hypothetical protein